MIPGASTIFALSGYVRRAGESDDSLNRLATKEGRESTSLNARLVLNLDGPGWEGGRWTADVRIVAHVWTGNDCPAAFASNCLTAWY